MEHEAHASSLGRDFVPKAQAAYTETVDSQAIIARVLGLRT